jgi:hypothetical protein
VVREVGEVWAGAADLAPESGAGYLKRAVGLTRLEANHFSIGQAAVLRFEFSIDQPVRRAQIVAVPGLGDDRDLQFGAIAEVVVPGGVAEALAVEVLFASLGQCLEAEPESSEFLVSQAAGL